LLCWFVQLQHLHRAPYHATATVTLAIVMLALAYTVIHRGRFRLLRLKEVDTVFDAFYLVHRHADECPRCAPSPSPGQSADDIARAQLVQDAFALSREGNPSGGPVILEQLVRLMKERSAGNHNLSYLYFAGSRDDHPYFLHNDRIAVGLAVLPEDAAKSRRAKRHPHQQEIIIVLDGQLCLERNELGFDTARTLETGDVVIIDPGQCHRILPVNNHDAAYVFVKTNPDLEPREELCTLSHRAND
jgi:mannose-6-phosphate isomerase-like protein (cupin superfamily)